jgi:hypothetical protein
MTQVEKKLRLKEVITGGYVIPFSKPIVRNSEFCDGQP